MKPDINDLFAFVGISLVAIGVGMVFLPLSLIVVGVFMLWLGIGGESK